MFSCKPIYILIVCIFLASCISPTSQEPGTISHSELKALLQKRSPEVVILDLRTTKEVNETGVIPGATVKDFFSEDIEQYFSRLEKDKEYVIYCKSGGRSGRAYKNLKRLGLNVRDYSDGISGWLKRNEKTARWVSR